MCKQLVVSVLMVCLVQSALAVERAPEPSQTQILAAEKHLREVYKRDFARRGVAAGRALARKLLENGRLNKTHSAAEYVLFRESRNLAVQYGDVATAMGAIVAMGEDFAVNPLDMKVAALQTMKATLQAQDALDAAAAAALALMKEAEAADDYVVAPRAVDLAIGFATAAKNAAIVTAAQGRKSDIDAQSTAYHAMKTSAEKLKIDPKDAASNYAVGIYLALYKNDWIHALPMLGQGNDPAFAEAARGDLAAPTGVAEMTKLADAWFDLASAHPAMKDRLLERAKFWYAQISTKSDGPVKAKVDSRLAQMAGATTPGAKTPAARTVRAPLAVSDATRAAIPSPDEMKKMKELTTALLVNTARQGEYLDLIKLLENRVLAHFAACLHPAPAPAAPTTKLGDFFALYRAEAEIRKVASVVPQYVIGNPGLMGSAESFLDMTTTQEELTSWLLAYEDLNNSEKAVDADVLAGVVFRSIRNFISRNPTRFPDIASQDALCASLKNEGVTSVGVDRYSTFIHVKQKEAPDPLKFELTTRGRIAKPSRPGPL